MKISILFIFLANAELESCTVACAFSGLGRRMSYDWRSAVKLASYGFETVSKDASSSRSDTFEASVHIFRA